MEESFKCQGKTWTRRELPDIPVKVSRKVSRAESASRYCPTVGVMWVGVHILTDGEREMTVGRSTVVNAGKLGASILYSCVTVRPKGAMI